MSVEDIADALVLKPVVASLPEAILPKFEAPEEIPPVTLFTSDSSLSASNTMFISATLYETKVLKLTLS